MIRTVSVLVLAAVLALLSGASPVWIYLIGSIVALVLLVEEPTK